MESIKSLFSIVAVLTVCLSGAMAQEVVPAVEPTAQEIDVDVEVRLQEAERRLAQAAQQVANLSMSQLPRVERIERVMRTGGGPVLGVTIGSDNARGPVEGVVIQGVSPGGAAEEAGLRSGDVMVSVNSESLMAASGEEANAKLLDFMQGVEAGDTLDIEFLRDGKSASTEVTPRPLDNNIFAFEFGGGSFAAPGAPVAPRAPHFGKFMWTTSDAGFGKMELAKLTERLGSYFGTDEGLLVVRAPEDDDLQLEDGDVILNIDGRKPTSVAHAMRILASYESGEGLEIEVMRDKRKRSVALTIPANDNRQSFNRPAGTPNAQPVIRQKIVVVDQD